MARTYKRDSNGRFASTGSARSGPKARMATRGTNRLTRDNSGRITSVGGQGATARGGRLRTASGAKRGAVVARLSLQRGGVIGKPRGLKPGVLKGRGASGGQAAAMVATGRTRKQAAAAQRSRRDKIAMAGDIIRDKNPKVSSDSRYSREDKVYLARDPSRPVLRFRKSKQPNLFGGTSIVRNRKGVYVGQMRSALQTGSRRKFVPLKDLSDRFFISRGKAAENRKLREMTRTAAGGAIGLPRSRRR